MTAIENHLISVSNYINKYKSNNYDRKSLENLFRFFKTARREHSFGLLIAAGMDKFTDYCAFPVEIKTEVMDILKDYFENIYKNDMERFKKDLDSVIIPACNTFVWQASNKKLN